MKLGLIARADNSGLGIQTLEFYRHMCPDKTLVVDISDLNGNTVYPERYPERAKFCKGFPADIDIREFLEGLDCVFIAEAAYNVNFYDIARSMGVKTAVQYNYEFMDWLVNPNYPKPDMFIAPSMWNYLKVASWCEQNQVKLEYLHCPVDREKILFRQIQQAKVFLHPAGRSAAHDRNGTELVIQAAAYIESDAKIIIHFQGEQGLPHQATHTIQWYKDLAKELNIPKERLEFIETEYENYEEAYKTGDVLLLPRRYGGNCLPLNEALSAGMPVIMTDIKPNNSLLPRDWLVPAFLEDKFTPRTEVGIYGVDPTMLARKIDYFARMSPTKVISESNQAGFIASTISWTALKPIYIAVLEKLCTQ